MSAGHVVTAILGGIAAIVAVAAASDRSKTERLPARVEPKLLPAPPPSPAPPQLPAAPAPRAPKRPVIARRVHDWNRTLVDEYGVEHAGRSYAPVATPAESPWVVTAWYDAPVDAEVISVEFAPSIHHLDIHFDVRRGEHLDPNRVAFRSKAHALWPSDKWNNRVVYRYKQREATGTFLIDVTVDGETIDFYHEPSRLPPQQLSKPIEFATVSPTTFGELTKSPTPFCDRSLPLMEYRDALVEIRKQRREIENSDLDEADKDELFSYLDKRVRDIKLKYMTPHGNADYFVPRR